eukprot:gnl/TRDRNA2_/TRDRNA2_159152_c0_seq3.p1 gnl/TRDRNA2_/TRDRNA2_159152_c0~~gnl/TRDRNA2_/TRDRNA2_159152_c0_seq3.p1  ORF type:complete len:229 (+),score=27.07 gnl/TRDRNA2_/TRDRNA2_159152_c0_seq3:129-815(+)
MCWWLPTFIAVVLIIPAEYAIRRHLGFQDRLVRPGVALQISTHLGPIEVRACGPADGPLAIALPDSGDEPYFLTEWDRRAEDLADVGYRVLLPDFQSNARTIPPGFFVSGISDEDAERVVMTLAGNRSLSLLLGKSWGGTIAGRFAAHHPAMVQRLVLIAPGLKDAALMRKLTMPVLLMFAKDDRAFNAFHRFKDNVGVENLHVTIADRGGHLILDTYAAPTRTFAKL